MSGNLYHKSGKTRRKFENVSVLHLKFIPVTPKLCICIRYTLKILKFQYVEHEDKT